MRPHRRSIQHSVDALEYGPWAVQDGNALRALGLISNWLDERSAAA
jgi:hypothetical protein